MSRNLFEGLSLRSMRHRYAYWSILSTLMVASLCAMNVSASVALTGTLSVAIQTQTNNAGDGIQDLVLSKDWEEKHW